MSAALLNLCVMARALDLACCMIIGRCLSIQRIARCARAVIGGKPHLHLCFRSMHVPSDSLTIPCPKRKGLLDLEIANKPYGSSLCFPAPQAFRVLNRLLYVGPKARKASDPKGLLRGWQPCDLPTPEDPLVLLSLMIEVAGIDGALDPAEWRVIRAFGRSWRVPKEVLAVYRSRQMDREPSQVAVLWRGLKSLWVAEGR